MGMLNWFGKSDSGAPEKRDWDLETAKGQERAVLFKHSSTCPVSWAAEAQVKRFMALHPDVPVYKLIVQQDRDLSRQIAEWSGIRHESPQVIVLRQGQVVSTESHEGVTVSYLSETAAG